MPVFDSWRVIIRRFFVRLPTFPCGEFYTLIFEPSTPRIQLRFVREDITYAMWNYIHDRWNQVPKFLIPIWLFRFELVVGLPEFSNFASSFCWWKDVEYEEGDEGNNETGKSIVEDEWA